MAIRQIGFQVQSNPLVQRFLLPNVRPTGQQLGVGSYGSVEEVEINGLTCAAKKLHEALIESGNFGAETICSKYVDECQLMSDLRHPNIVQFLGLCFLPGFPLPLLVMERLSTSLDDLLENSPNIPLAMKRSILADVASGLVYLHTHDPPVIHRDLSARNVLLNSAMMAKISDLGNSRIVDLRPGQLARTLSRLPGTMVYMAPEAFHETSRYGTKLDMFSFGHLGLFTVIQDFPGNLLPSIYPDPDDPDIPVARSEVERRGTYFEQLKGQLGVGHPLERLIRGCLHIAPSRRPSAEEALQQLEDMRALLQDPYEAMNKLEMVRTMQEKDREIQQLQAQIPPSADDQSRQQIEALQQQMQQLQLDHSAVEETLRVDLQTREEELREREDELQQKNADKRRLENQLRTAQQQLASMQADLQANDTKLQQRRIELQDKTAEIQLKNADVNRLTNDLRIAHISLQTQRAELQERISRLMQQNSDHERTLASLRTDLQAREALLREKEGETQEKKTEISKLLREVRSLQSQLSRIQEDTHQKDDRLRHKEVEISSLRRQLQSGRSKPLKVPLELRWKECQNMPFAMSALCSVVLNGKVYVGGGYSPSYDVMVCDLANWRWDKLPPYKATFFGMAVINNQLVLVGGRRQTGHNKPIDQLSVWDEKSRQWKPELFPPMKTPRIFPSLCTYGKWLVVAGGYGEDGHYTKTVELLDTTTNEWYMAASLPQACSVMRSAVVGDTGYLLGGSIIGTKATKKVFSISLPDLISQATSQFRSRPNELWQELPDAPLTHSAPLALHGSLLAVGGNNDSNEDSTAIYVYQLSAMKWVKAGDLPRARSNSCCVSLSSGEFLVLGGYGPIDRVDMGTVLNAD